MNDFLAALLMRVRDCRAWRGSARQVRDPYHAGRARQELRLARQAASPVARDRHLTLAALHLCQSKAAAPPPAP